MKAAFFKNREGQTALEESMRSDLIPRHVQDMTELYELEMENMAEGILYLENTKKNHLDYLFWLEVHKMLLSGVWKFAGRVRKTELANPEFHLPYDVLPALKQLEEDLKFWINNSTYPKKELAAIFHERLITIHPFKDGNGRWARILTEFFCRRESIEVPNWGRNIVDDKNRRDQYIAAIKKARHNSLYQELIDLMFHSAT